MPEDGLSRHAVFSNDLELVHREIIVDDLRNALSVKMGGLKHDLSEKSKEIAYEKRLREEAERRANYYKQKLNLVELYPNSNVRPEMQTRLSPLRRLHEKGNVPSSDMSGMFISPSYNKYNFIKDKVHSGDQMDGEIKENRRFERKHVLSSEDREERVEEVSILESELRRAEDQISLLNVQLNDLKSDNQDMQFFLGVKLTEKLALSQSELKTQVLRGDIQTAEVEAQVARKAAEAVQSISNTQKERDDAVNSRLESILNERAKLIKLVDELEMKNKYLQDQPDPALKKLALDDSEPTLEELLKKIEMAKNGTEIHKNGSIILDRVIESNAAKRRIHNEELQFVIEERNELRKKVAIMEEEMISFKKYGISTDSDQDNRLNRSLKAAALEAIHEKDIALRTVEQLKSQLAELQSSSRTGSLDALREKLNNVPEAPVKFNRDPKVEEYEQQIEELSHKLNSSNEHNSELKRLVNVLRKKLADR